MPIGAEPARSGGVHFRVWAPEAARVEVGLTDEAVAAPTFFNLTAEGNGYFSGHVDEASPGDCYGFRLDGCDSLLPDPASRFQPLGPHGPSQIVDPLKFEWSDQKWAGVASCDRVIYEMHVGAFTAEGTWAAATGELQELANLGITLVEVMPVGDFPGRFGWGYDGVNLFAPTRLYGKPDEFRRFVDRAHQVGIGVILDVVYNHLGPDGNYLPQFSQDYFSAKRKTDWGKAINFDGKNSGPVREFYLENAAYWIREYHLDGLRLDATQDVHDSSSEHILAAVSDRTRRAAAPRSVYIVAENEPQHAQLAQPREKGGYDIDALWNDDFHHSATVRLWGRNEAYYSDYLGRPQEFISAIKSGFLYQGQWYSWQKKPRGTPTRELDHPRFVHFIQNHDQIANTALGQRAHTWTSPGRIKAITALLLLGPATPMLFQGQEFAASTPFFYFADHKPELAERVNRGRKEFMAQFPSVARPEVQAQLPDPGDPSTFVRCKLQASDRASNEAMYRLHRDLITLRRDDSVFRDQEHARVDGAVLGEDAFVLRFFGEQGDDRLILINFGADLHLRPMPEPLLAPPAERGCKRLWSSEDLCYGGSGTPPIEKEGSWLIAGQAAIVLAATPPGQESSLSKTSEPA